MHRYLFLGDDKIQWYVILNFVAFFPVFIFNLCNFRARKENISVLSGKLQKYFQKKIRINSHVRFLKKKTFWLVIEIFLLSVAQIVPATFLTKVSGSIFNTGNNYFGFLFTIPLLLFVVYWLFGIDPISHFDLTTPAFSLALIVIKLACFCEGCCYGIESTVFGMYNHKNYATEVPVQLIEAGWGVLLFIVLFAIRKKAKPGTLFPLYTILYSATRFCSEFLRNEENVLGPFKAYHLFCIAGVIIGIVQYILTVRYGERFRRFFSDGCFVYIDRLTEKRKKKKRAKQKAKKKNKKRA